MNVFELFSKVTIDTSGFKEGLEAASNSFTSFGEKIKSGVATAAKITAGAAAAGAAAVGKVVKDAIGAYGEFEQLTGGIDKLYGDAAEAVQNYAAQAFRTTGMSANDYMQTVTAFSASLINDLGGDTATAAEIANTAMQDIADNANIFGTQSAEELSNVYKALARGNFQTLDNLNLGYAGTKEGMEQLIADANALAAANGKAANYSIDSFSDMVQAIHEVQENMNITGTTANEAAGTIQGSINTMKASWQNLLTGLASGDTNKVQSLFSNLLGSGADVIKNIKPRVKVILDSIGKIVIQQAPAIFEKIPAIIADILPDAAGAVGGLLSSLGGAIVKGAPMLLNAGKDLVFQLMEGIQAQSGTILTSGSALITSLIGGISSSLPEFVDIAFNVVSSLGDFLIANAPIMLNTAADLMAKLGEGLTKAVGKILDKVPEIMKDLKDTFNDGESIRKVFEAAAEIMRKLGTGLVDNIMAIGEKIPEVVESIKRFFLDTNWLDVGRQILEGILSGFLDVDFSIEDYLSDFKDNFVTGVKDIFGIHSPSKLMADEVGKYLALGVGEGMTDNINTALPKRLTLQNFAHRTAGEIITQPLTAPNTTTNNNTANYYVTLNVDRIDNDKDLEKIAAELGRKLEEQRVRNIRACGGTGWT